MFLIVGSVCYKARFHRCFFVWKCKSFSTKRWLWRKFTTNWNKGIVPDMNRVHFSNDKLTKYDAY